MFEWLKKNKEKNRKEEESLDKKVRRRVKEKRVRVSISIKKEENDMVNSLSEKLKMPNSHLWRAGIMTIKHFKEEEIKDLLEKINQY